jgi:hypothetical protein
MNVGLVHWVFVNGYTDTTGYDTSYYSNCYPSPTYTWLSNDLAAVNRATTPWVVRAQLLLQHLTWLFDRRWQGLLFLLLTWRLSAARQTPGRWLLGDIQPLKPAAA